MKDTYETIDIRSGRRRRDWRSDAIFESTKASAGFSSRIGG
jgi:hypothetical protein